MDLKIPLIFYNTETRKKEVFEPLESKLVKMYTCGPTVYHYAHIGNFRTYVVEDLIRRVLKSFGYRVFQVMNITDVDDKTIRSAIEKNISLEDATKPYAAAFFEDAQTLNIERVEEYPYATNYIPQMIEFIEKLLEKGVAYVASDKSIYYSIKKAPRYACLCHLTLDELKPGAGHECNDEYEKDNVSDFVLWKAYDPKRDGHIFWESAFGPGRPGWHLECSTMAMSLLGETIDLHMGGVDNIFPHHENEIAQSEAFSGKQFVRHWIHVEHLLVNHRKMSKSLGNFYTLRDLLGKGYSGVEVRYLLMQTHYRTQLNFTLEGLEGARTALQRINDFALRMGEIEGGSGSLDEAVSSIVAKARQAFFEAIASDLNISAALAVLFDFMHEINTHYDKGRIAKAEGVAVTELLKQFNQILGVMSFESEEIPAELNILLQKREEARKKKEYQLADQCRKEIDQRGYIIEDTPKGPRLKKK